MHCAVAIPVSLQRALRSISAAQTAFPAGIRVSPPVPAGHIN
jgi:hypothetical protein